jgi:4-amino-4-deoxy-L-arabinose transferase-like glycosyltransferase
VPIGLWRDEAANGLEALRVLDGQYAIFYGTREPVFIYLVAISVAFLGRTPLAIRLVSAIVGAATIPVTYLLVKELFRSTDHRARAIASLTSLWLATSYWHISFSRLGFRGILLPLLASLSFYFLWRGWNQLTRVCDYVSSQRSLTLVWFALAGLCFGLTMYTYTAARFLLVALLPFLGCIASLGWRKARRRGHGHKATSPPVSPLRAGVVFGLVFLLVFAPLGAHFISHTSSFFARSGISVFRLAQDEPLAVVLAGNTVRQLGMFGLTADPNVRHDTAGRPAFDLFTLLFFVVGAAVCIRRWTQVQYLFLLSWFCAMLLPAILTYPELPHFLRAIGALPVAYVFPALGVERAWHWAPARRFPRKLRPALAALLALYFTVSGLFTYRDYFWPAVEEMELVKAFDPRFVEVASLMNELDAPDSVWIIPLGPNGEQRMAYFVIDFLYQGQAPHVYIPLDESTAPRELRLACQGRRRAMVLNRTADPVSQPWFDLYADSKGLIAFLLDQQAQSLERAATDGLEVLVYELPSNVSFSLPSRFARLDVAFGEELRLAGIACECAASSAPHASIVMRWQAAEQPTTDYNVQVALEDDAGKTVTSMDKVLLSGEGRPTSEWDAGQEEIGYFTLSGLPAETLEGYNMSIAVVAPQDGERSSVSEGRLLSAALCSQPDTPL